MVSFLQDVSGDLFFPAVKREVSEFIKSMPSVTEPHFWDCISNWVPIKSPSYCPLGPWDDDDFLYFIIPECFTFPVSPINLAYDFDNNPLIKYFKYSTEKVSTHFFCKGLDSKYFRIFKPRVNTEYIIGTFIKILYIWWCSKYINNWVYFIVTV